MAEQSAQTETKTIEIDAGAQPDRLQEAQKETVKALGLRRLHQIVERPDNRPSAAWSTACATWWK